MEVKMNKFNVLISWSGNNYAATFESQDINGMIISTHKTFEGVKNEFLRGLKSHIEVCMEDGDSLPEYVQNGDYKIVYELDTSALLHRFDGILTRSAIARATGINERQIGHYASGNRTPRPAQREKIIAGIHKIGDMLISI
jgi:hypothetical protein